MKSKKDFVADYVALGGAREDFPENLDDTTVAAIEAKIETLNLAAQLKGAEDEQTPDAAAAAAKAGAENTPKTDEDAEALKLQEQLKEAEGDKEQTNPDAPAKQVKPAAPKAPKETQNNEIGVLFTLTKAATFNSAALPDNSYKAGELLILDEVEDAEEIAILRKSGLFKEGE